MLDVRGVRHVIDVSIGFIAMSIFFCFWGFLLGAPMGGLAFRFRHNFGLVSHDYSRTGRTLLDTPKWLGFLIPPFG